MASTFHLQVLDKPWNQWSTRKNNQNCPVQGGARSIVADSNLGSRLSCKSSTHTKFDVTRNEKLSLCEKCEINTKIM